MATISRVKLTEEFEEITVPQGYIVCDMCKGRGMMSDYDMGWSSLVHSPELAAKKPCMGCGGEGYVYDFSQRRKASQDQS